MIEKEKLLRKIKWNIIPLYFWKSAKGCFTHLLYLDKKFTVRILKTGFS